MPQALTGPAKTENNPMSAVSPERRKALITLLEKAEDGIAGKTGTVISQ